MKGPQRHSGQGRPQSPPATPTGGAGRLVTVAARETDLVVAWEPRQAADIAQALLLLPPEMRAVAATASVEAATGEAATGKAATGKAATRKAARARKARHEEGGRGESRCVPRPAAGEGFWAQGAIWAVLAHNAHANCPFILRKFSQKILDGESSHGCFVLCQCAGRPCFRYPNGMLQCVCVSRQ